MKKKGRDLDIFNFINGGVMIVLIFIYIGTIFTLKTTNIINFHNDIDIKGVINIALFALLLIQFYVHFRHNQKTYRHNRKKDTLEICARILNNNDILTMGKYIHSLDDQDDKDKQILEYTKKDGYQTVSNFLNTLEEISIGYYKDVYDKDIILPLIESNIISVYQTFVKCGVIEWKSSYNTYGYLIYWKTLMDELQTIQNKKRRDDIKEIN